MDQIQVIQVHSLYWVLGNISGNRIIWKRKKETAAWSEFIYLTCQDQIAFQITANRWKTAWVCVRVNVYSLCVLFLRSTTFETIFVTFRILHSGFWLNKLKTKPQLTDPVTAAAMVVGSVVRVTWVLVAARGLSIVTETLDGSVATDELQATLLHL